MISLLLSVALFGQLPGYYPLPYPPAQSPSLSTPIGYPSASQPVLPPLSIGPVMWTSINGSWSQITIINGQGPYECELHGVDLWGWSWCDDWEQPGCLIMKGTPAGYYHLTVTDATGRQAGKTWVVSPGTWGIAQ